MRILVIEDDKDTRESLLKNLASGGYTVDGAIDGESGSYIARTNPYNLIITDHFLPIKDGYQVCKEIRNANIHTPILFLSINNSITDKVQIFEAGADDHLVKPFSFAELLARIKALTRRPYSIEDSVLQIDDLTINMSAKEVSHKGERVYLTRKEFSLLECMARKPGKIITRGEILEDAWGHDNDPFSNTIEAHIRNLRKKIGDMKERRYIQTVPGRGYKLDRCR
jgi:DNA-binding response OmpR family regulator